MSAEPLPRGLPLRPHEGYGRGGPLHACGAPMRNVGSCREPGLKGEPTVLTQCLRCGVFVQWRAGVPVREVPWPPLPAGEGPG